MVFTQNTAIILTNPDNWEELFEYPNSIPEPDFSLVEKVPPHFWKQDGANILPMSEEERKFRLKHIEEHGLIKDIEPIDSFQYKPEPAKPAIMEKIVEVHTIYENAYLKLAVFAAIAAILITQILNLVKK